MVKKERIPRPPKHTKRENQFKFFKGENLTAGKKELSQVEQSKGDNWEQHVYAVDTYTHSQWRDLYNKKLKHSHFDR